MLSRERTIYKLKELISEYEEEVRELEQMCRQWNDHDDPGSDPGLQYEQECKVDKMYQEVIQFAKTLKS